MTVKLIANRVSASAPRPAARAAGRSCGGSPVANAPPAPGTLAATPLAQGPLVRAVRYDCSAGPAHRPFAETHAGHSVSYVSRGSFAYTARGRRHDLVAGAVLVGAPGVEYVCSHDHHGCGDQCIAFHLSAAAVEEIGGDTAAWRRGGIAPHASLAVLGELARAAAAGRADAGLDEIGLMLAARAMRMDDTRIAARIRPGAAERRRATRAADWLQAHAAEPVDLAAAAHAAGLSPFHFLRLFSACVGATPHQYLLCVRIRDAARRLLADEAPVTTIAFDAGFGDLSNFIRNFRRAAGLSPRAFRLAARDTRDAVAHRLAGRAAHPGTRSRHSG